MKKKKWNKLVSVLLVMVTVMSLLSGCGGKSAEKEDAETITVYLWTTSLYEKYASYIQEQLPDINIEFVVGNNNLDFYRFLDENGGLPDIITCCRFSLHDASPLKDSLMDLSTTNAAGAVYDTYLNSFRNQDGSVNWLPVCADAHGFVVNKDLFEKYDIPLPTDYESFVSACQAFDEVGIVGLLQTITMIIPVWKHCRVCLHQSCLLWMDVSGVPSTVTRTIQREKVWTVPSGRRLLNVWSSLFRIQG
jgi:raffinose/stachyose/melibiose transport system substrate-binding protein